MKRTLRFMGQVVFCFGVKNGQKLKVYFDDVGK